MEITGIRVQLWDDERLKGFVNVTFDDCFIVRGMKIIEGDDGYFIAMPSRKRADGTYRDIAHPLNGKMRRRIEEQVLQAFLTEMRQGAVDMPARAAGVQRMS